MKGGTRNGKKVEEMDGGGACCKKGCADDNPHPALPPPPAGCIPLAELKNTVSYLLNLEDS